MKITSLIYVFTILTVQICFGQNKELERLKKLNKTLDSLSKLERPFSIDSTTTTNVRQLDKGHPSKYFYAAMDILNSNKYNDAAFLFYLGTLRYKFYNLANPDYQASEDGAYEASLLNLIGEAINIYLKTNIDNYISALKFTIDYYQKNDFFFFSKHNNKEKHEQIANKFLNTISDLESNKITYKKKWDNDIKLIIHNNNEMIDYINKKTLEQEAKFNKN